MFLNHDRFLVPYLCFYFVYAFLPYIRLFGECAFAHVLGFNLFVFFLFFYLCICIVPFFNVFVPYKVFCALIMILYLMILLLNYDFTP